VLEVVILPRAVSGKAGGRAQLAPPADLVGRAREELRIDKAFHHHDRMAPALPPILAQAPKHQLHEPADQVRIVALRQEEQPGVVGQQSQPLAPLLLLPADKAVARAQMQRRRRPQRQSQPLVLEHGHVAQLLADGRCGVQVVVLDQQRVKARLFFRSHEAHGEVIENMLFVRGRTPIPRSVFSHASFLSGGAQQCPALNSIPHVFRHFRHQTNQPYRMSLQRKTKSTF
jgi:hypothetical protein